MKNTVLTPLCNVSLENLSPVDSPILLGNARLLPSAAEAFRTTAMLGGAEDCARMRELVVQTVC